MAPTGSRPRQERPFVERPLSDRRMPERIAGCPLRKPEDTTLNMCRSSERAVGINATILDVGEFGLTYYLFQRFNRFVGQKFLELNIEWILNVDDRKSLSILVLNKTSSSFSFFRDLLLNISRYRLGVTPKK